MYPGRLGSPVTNGSNAAAEEPCPLAGQERPVVAHPVGRVDEVGQAPAGRAELRQHGAERREVSGDGLVISRPPDDRRPAGQRVVGPGVVVGDRVVDRPDERQVVGLLRQHRQVLAELAARHGRLDRLELAADLRGGVGLHVPGVLVRRAPFQEHQDHRLDLRPARCRRLPARSRPGRLSPSRPAPPTRRTSRRRGRRRVAVSRRDAQHGSTALINGKHGRDSPDAQYTEPRFDGTGFPRPAPPGRPACRISPDLPVG